MLTLLLFLLRPSLAILNSTKKYMKYSHLRGDLNKPPRLISRDSHFSTRLPSLFGALVTTFICSLFVKKKKAFSTPGKPRGILPWVPRQQQRILLLNSNSDINSKGGSALTSWRDRESPPTGQGRSMLMSLGPLGDQLRTGGILGSIGVK